MMSSESPREVILYWSNADAAFIAEVPELPGCMADGETEQAALAAIARESPQIILFSAPAKGGLDLVTLRLFEVGGVELVLFRLRHGDLGQPGYQLAGGVEAFGVDAFTQIGGPGDPAYETFRLAWPATRTGAAAVGLTEDDLRCIDGAFANSTVLVGVTIFAAWGQLPRRSDKRSSHM